MGDSPTEPLRYTLASGAGRFDNDGVEWFACDPYPTWYRWEGGKLITCDVPDAGWAE